MMALGIYLANSRNDPDYQKAGAVIEAMRQSIAANAKALSAPAQAAALRHGQHLLDIVSGNLRSLRGEGGAPN